MPRYSAFLSYARADGDKIEPFAAALKERGLPFWIDRQGITSGDLWEAAIRRALTQSDAMVVFVTRNVLDSYVGKEVEIGRELRKHVIPVALDDTILDEHPTIALLRKSHYVDARRGGAHVTKEVSFAVENAHRSPVMSIYNVKGGVGKTTIAANVGAALYTRFGKRVLLLDFDPQTNLSTAVVGSQIVKSSGVFGRKSTITRVDVLDSLRAQKKSAMGVIERSAAVADDIDAGFDVSFYTHRLAGEGEGPALDIVVGDKSLKDFAVATSKAKVDKISKGFDRFIGQCRRQYDCILLDLNPSYNLIARCALSASTHIVSPVRPDQFSMQGLDLLDDIATEIESISDSADQLILINDPREDKNGIVRANIQKSKYADRLIPQDLVYSRYFYANPETTVKGALDRLPAFGNWGSVPRRDRLALEAVTREIAEKVGLPI